MSISKIQVRVDDMMCNGCEDTIQDELRQLKGVERVSANHIEGTVDIVGDPDIDSVVAAIDRRGFTAHR